VGVKRRLGNEVQRRLNNIQYKLNSIQREINNIQCEIIKREGFVDGEKD
jgi:hypothetical protein